MAGDAVDVVPHSEASNFKRKVACRGGILADEMGLGYVIQNKKTKIKTQSKLNNLSLQKNNRNYKLGMSSICYFYFPNI
jgi:hypothetical protein